MEWNRTHFYVVLDVYRHHFSIHFPAGLASCLDIFSESLGTTFLSLSNVFLNVSVGESGHFDLCRALQLGDDFLPSSTKFVLAGFEERLVDVERPLDGIRDRLQRDDRDHVTQALDIDGALSAL